LEAGTAPKLTVLAAVNAVPVIVTDVPPPVGPEVGLRLSTVGTALKVYWSPAFADETPPLVVTITSTVPGDSSGDSAVIEVDEFTTTPVAAPAPNATEAPVMKPVPVIVTDVLPAVGPEFGTTDVTV